MKTVRVYSEATGLVTDIPESELAPGMLRVHQDGVGEVYVASHELEGSKTVDRGLPHGFEKHALDAWRVISRGATWIKSPEGWVDGFRADQHPVRELMHWMSAAVVYHEMTHDGTDSGEVCADILKVLANAMTNGRQAIQTIEPQRVSKARARAAIEAFLSLKEVGWVEFWLNRTDVEALFALRKSEEDQRQQS